MADQPKEKTEKRDALADARGCLDAIGGFYDGHEGRDDRDVRALWAIASAQIAIAEQLDRLNDQLEKSAIEVGYGGRTV
jgi:hypothetical protein